MEDPAAAAPEVDGELDEIFGLLLLSIFGFVPAGLEAPPMLGFEDETDDFIILLKVKFKLNNMKKL